MKKIGLLGTIVPLLTSAGMTFAQTASTPTPIAPSPVPITTAPVMAEGDGHSVMNWTDGGSAGNGPKFWADADYLLFWLKNGPGGPPLVTTTTVGSALTLPNAGGVGVPGTSILYNQGQDYGTQSGVQLNVYGWLDCDNTIGFNVSGFWLQQGSSHALFGSDGSAGSIPLLLPANVLPTTPFVTPGPNAAGIASGPGLPVSTVGAISITSRSNLWGAEANGMVNLIRSEGLMVNGLAGFRYMDLKEDLSIYTNSSNNPNVPGSFVLFPGAGGFGQGTVATQDSFSTRNQFYGANFGAEARATFGQFFVDLTGKIALGDNYHSTLNVNGLTMVNGTNMVTGAAVTGAFPGGIYALPTNSGKYSKDVFAYVPEVDLKVGYAITQNIKATVGYDFMYWSSVVRPGDQINPYIDVRQIPATGAVYTPGAAFTGPTPIFKSTDFWAQGVTFGLEFSF